MIANAPRAQRCPLLFPGLLRFGGLIALLTVGFAPTHAQPPPKEYQIKAVFLLNFASFVEWPPAAFAEPNAPIVIGVLGADPFGSALDEVVSGEKVQNHPVLVRRTGRASDLRGCQIVFIGQSERRRLATVLSGFRGAPVLTVSDIPGFAEDGGVVEFYLEANRVRFAINPATAAQQGIKLSSQLLVLARIVKEPHP